MMPAISTELREQNRGVQRAILLQKQRIHHGILLNSDVLSKANKVVKIQLGRRWTEEHEAVTHNTRFIVSRGPVVENLRDKFEYFCITKLEGDKRVWGAEIGGRITEKDLARNSVEASMQASNGFDLDDVRLVAGLADELSALQQSGELSGLDYYLDKIK